MSSASVIKVPCILLFALYTRDVLFLHHLCNVIQRKQCLLLTNFAPPLCQSPFYSLTAYYLNFVIGKALYNSFSTDWHIMHACVHIHKLHKYTTRILLRDTKNDHLRVFEEFKMIRWNTSPLPSHSIYFCPFPFPSSFPVFSLHHIRFYIHSFYYFTPLLSFVACCWHYKLI